MGKKSGEWTRRTRQKEKEGRKTRERERQIQRERNRKGKSHDSPEIPDRRETLDVPSLPVFISIYIQGR